MSLVCNSFPVSHLNPVELVSLPVLYVVSYLCPLCIKGTRFVLGSSQDDYNYMIMIS